MSNTPAHWSTDQERIDLMEFLVEKTKNVQKPLSVQMLSKEFKEKTGSATKLTTICSRVRYIHMNIHNFENLDTTTKVRMLFGLSGNVDDNFLNELRKDALVEVDQLSRISTYIAKDGSLHLEGEHSGSTKIKDGWLEKMKREEQIYCSPETFSSNLECIELINFLVEKTKNAKPPLSFEYLAREFKKRTGTMIPVSKLIMRIERARTLMHQLSQLDTDTKVRMMFALSVHVDDSFLNTLKEQADVTIDNHNRIIEYKSKSDGGLELKGSHNRASKEAEFRDKKMLELLEQKSKNAEAPMYDNAFLKDFKELTGATECSSHLASRYQIVKNSIYDSPDYDKETKIRMIFLSCAKLGDDALRELRKNALVEVDEKNRIIKYSDNNMHLEGRLPKVVRPKREWPVVPRPPTKRVKLEQQQQPEEVDDEEMDLKMYTAPKAPTPSETPAPPELTQLSVMKSLQNLVVTLQIHSLSEDIRTKIRRATTEKFPLECLPVALQLCYFIIINKAKEGVCTENSESMSLQIFLFHFRELVIGMGVPTLDTFQKELEEAIGELFAQDKTVPIEQVKCGLQAVLNIVIG